MIDISQNGLTSDEILTSIYSRTGIQNSSFILVAYRNGVYYKELDCYKIDIVCNIENSVKYNATFELNNDDDILWNTDRFIPYMTHRYGDQLLTFPLSPPLRVGTREQTIDYYLDTLKIECYDESSFLLKNSLDESLYYPKGSSYISIITDIMNKADFYDYIITPTEKVIMEEREFSEGTGLLELINELLEEINYYSLYPDITGILYSSPYIYPEEATPSIYYTEKFKSVIKSPIKVTYDTFDKYNRFIGYYTNPDSDETFREVVTNDSPTSPTSTTNIGYILTDSPKSYNNVADAQTLYNLVYKESVETSLSYKTISFDTFALPTHGVNEYIAIDNDFISGVYNEISWTIQVDNETANMSHVVRGLFND